MLFMGLVTLAQQEATMTHPSDGLGRMINVNQTERLASLVGGGVLAVLGMRRSGMAGTAMALAGGALVVRGLSGYCPVYTLLETDDERLDAAIPTQDVEEGRNKFARHPGDIYSDCDESVDETSKESFPASDPPSFSPGTT